MTSSSDLAVGARCWILDEGGEDGFILGTIASLTSDSVTVRDEDSQQHVLPLTDVFPCNPDNQSGCKDNTELMFLREPHMLHNLRQRYARDAVYTYTAHILIACNPFKKLAIYSEERMAEYAGKSLGLMEPHVFAVADRAYRSMKHYKQSQAVIISGESGSEDGDCKDRDELPRVGGRERGQGRRRGRVRLARLARPPRQPRPRVVWQRAHAAQRQPSRFGKFTKILFSAEGRIAGR